MNASEIITKAAAIIARTDVVRTTMLDFINVALKAAIRDKNIHKLYGYQAMTHTNGLIDGTMIKHLKAIYYTNTQGTAKLSKLADFNAAMVLYPDFTVTGTPEHYLEVGADIQLLPVPTTGTLKVYGEFWPADLTDSTGSTNVFTLECPEALYYMGAAEYFDFFDENAKAQLWRQKGTAILESYIKQSAKQTLYGIHIDQDPLGNGGV